MTMWSSDTERLESLPSAMAVTDTYKRSDIKPEDSPIADRNSDCDMDPMDKRTYPLWEEFRAKGVAITLVDFAEKHCRYKIRQYIAKFLLAVPAEDLRGITRIRLHDDVPLHIPNRNAAAGFFAPEQTENDGTWIEIYLGPTLLYLPDMEKEGAMFVHFRNVIFLRLFGRIFLAASLFHEIGHHKHSVFLPRELETETESEEKAVSYENSLLSIAFPFLQQYYTVFNTCYRWLYRHRINYANQKRGG